MPSKEVLMRSQRSHRGVAVARANSWLLMADPAPIVVTVGMPLLLMAFLMPPPARSCTKPATPARAAQSRSCPAWPSCSPS